jgi:predicted extracellular nuclease
VQRLAAPPLANQVERIFEPDRYTFNIEGVSQVLDHAVVSRALAAGAEIDVVHLESDCADARRASDHDPIVIRVPLD